LNLLLNGIEAVQHSRQGGKRRVEIELTSSDDHAKLYVSDTGDGPSNPSRDSIFEPFVTTKPEGVGLGLTMARQVVEAHGGEISWQRRDGRTEFRVALPLAVKEASVV
jgi:nitrogen-specific signal transduction histidine kinase